jgi:MFS family permease
MLLRGGPYGASGGWPWPWQPLTEIFPLLNTARSCARQSSRRPSVTTIEWYDFFIYGTAAGLVFGKLYFPNEDPLTATLAAFGTYFIGFVGRPIGAAIFGHYGDRIGRKATLIATLLCMGIASPSRCPVTSPIVSDAERCT